MRICCTQRQKQNKNTNLNKWAEDKQNSSLHDENLQEYLNQVIEEWIK